MSKKPTLEDFLGLCREFLSKIPDDEDKKKIQKRIKKIENSDEKPAWADQAFFTEIMNRYTRIIKPEVLIKAKEKGTIDDIISKAENALSIKDTLVKMLRIVHAFNP